MLTLPRQGNYLQAFFFLGLNILKYFFEIILNILHIFNRAPNIIALERR